MIKTENTDYGFRVTFEGQTEPSIVSEWLQEWQQAAQQRGDRFGVLIDLRHTRLFPEEAERMIRGTLPQVIEAGLTRAALVFDNAPTNLQARLVNRATGTHSMARHLDAAKTADWEQRALAWIKEGVEPYA